MGKFLSSLVPVESIDLDAYAVLPLGSAGEALIWLSDLIARGTGAVGFVKRDASVIAGLKRAVLKIDGVPFEVPVYKTEKISVTVDGKSVSKTVRVKDAEGKAVKTYDPPASKRMGRVFTAHHANGASVHIERLDGNDTVSADSRELVRVTVQ